LFPCLTNSRLRHQVNQKRFNVFPQLRRLEAQSPCLEAEISKRFGRLLELVAPIARIEYNVAFHYSSCPS
jgi:hypothetical protein